MFKCKVAKPQKKELMQEKLAETHEIRPFPGAVSKLMSALKDPNSNSKTFAKIIEMDAALSTKILRMVNSPMFGFSNEIRTIDQAVTVLGQKPLKNLALAFAGSSLISGDTETKKICEALWAHSLACAIVAKLLSNHIPSVNPDDAFLAGIFHDIGKLIFVDVDPQDYAKLATSYFGDDLLIQEKETYGTTHVEVGLSLTVAWPLPDEIKGAIRYHHEPSEDSTHADLSKLIQVADGLAKFAGIGSAQDQSICVADAANEYFGLDEAALDTIIESAREVFEVTQQAYSR